MRRLDGQILVTAQRKLQPLPRPRSAALPGTSQGSTEEQLLFLHRTALGSGCQAGDKTRGLRLLRLKRTSPWGTAGSTLEGAQGGLLHVPGGGRFSRRRFSPDFPGFVSLSSMTVLNCL